MSPDDWFYRVEGLYDVDETPNGPLGLLLTGDTYTGWIHKDGIIPCDGVPFSTMTINDLPIYSSSGILIGTATPIPNWTMTPPPSYADTFPAPILNPTHPLIRLTNCGFGGSEIIFGRDVNPYQNPGEYDLITVAPAEITLVDETLGENNNAGLGIYLVYRVAMSDLDNSNPALRQAITDFVQLQRPNQGSNFGVGGYIHIAYAHIMKDSVQAGVVPGAKLAANTKIAMSDSTGNTQGPHLDVTVIYTSSNRLLPDKRPVFGEISKDVPPIEQKYTGEHHYNGHFSMFLNNRLNTVMIDPLIIWPYFQKPVGDASICAYQIEYLTDNGTTP